MFLSKSLKANIFEQERSRLNLAYIYKITNDVNQKIYVGKTEFSIEKRFKEHCNDAFRERNEKRPLYAAMRKYGVEHFHVELLEETDKPEEREKYWIEQLGSFKWGYNATMGGDGKRYLDYDLVVATYNKVKNLHEVSRILGCDYNHISNILKTNGVRVLNKSEVSKREFSKQVGKFDKEDGSLLGVFPSIKDAAKSISKPYTHISECANGKRKTAYGFIWKFI